jgi:hypothetical protein
MHSALFYYSLKFRLAQDNILGLGGFFIWRLDDHFDIIQNLDLIYFGRGGFKTCPYSLKIKAAGFPLKYGEERKNQDWRWSWKKKRLAR